MKTSEEEKFAVKCYNMKMSKLKGLYERIKCEDKKEIIAAVYNARVGDVKVANDLEIAYRTLKAKERKRG